LTVFDRIRAAFLGPDVRAHAPAPEQTTFDLNDPAFYEFVRSGGVSIRGAMQNTAVFRCVELTTGTFGALPLLVMRRTKASGNREAVDHPLYAVLADRPNNWQNAYQFKQLMQHWALVHGNAYAIIVRSMGRVVALQPVHPARVSVEQRSDWSLEYKISRLNGSSLALEGSEVLHIRGPSDDGITGLSRVRLAADAIEIGVASQLAIRRIFENGMLVGGNLSHPNKLSPEAYERLRKSIEKRHAGAQNAGRWILTEEGMTAKPFEMTAVDAQITEVRSAIIEDIGRVFGVPRPLLGVDDTSWGSGIEQLAILFVRFGLAPWFKAWEEELKIKCIGRDEWSSVYVDFQERELLRGTIKEQFEAYAKAAGAGGHKPFMEPNEIRDDIGLGPHVDGFGLHSAGEMRRHAEMEGKD
jgi:HK97 family phage portal protein